MRPSGYQPDALYLTELPVQANETPSLSDQVSALFPWFDRTVVTGRLARWSRSSHRRAEAPSARVTVYSNNATTLVSTINAADSRAFFRQAAW